MKQTLKKINWLNIAQMVVILALAVAPLLIPSVVNAQGGGQLPGFPCDSSSGLRCQDASVSSIFRTVINWALGIAFGLAVIFLIIGGFRYITSAGNEEAAEKGKSSVVNALIGIVIIVLSYVIINVVYNFLTSSGNGIGP